MEGPFFACAVLDLIAAREPLDKWTSRDGRWLCAVARRENGYGFLITAYPTEAIRTDALLPAHAVKSC